MLAQVLSGLALPVPTVLGPRRPISGCVGLSQSCMASVWLVASPSTIALQRGLFSQSWGVIAASAPTEMPATRSKSRSTRSSRRPTGFQGVQCDSRSMSWSTGFLGLDDLVVERQGRPRGDAFTS